MYKARIFLMDSLQDGKAPEKAKKVVTRAAAIAEKAATPATAIEPQPSTFRQVAFCNPDRPYPGHARFTVRFEENHVQKTEFVYRFEDLRVPAESVDLAGKFY